MSTKATFSPNDQGVSLYAKFPKVAKEENFRDAFAVIHEGKTVINVRIFRKGKTRFAGVWVHLGTHFVYGYGKDQLSNGDAAMQALQMVGFSFPKHTYSGSDNALQDVLRLAAESMNLDGCFLYHAFT